VEAQVTKQQAEAAVDILAPKYPEAAVVSEMELEEDSNEVPLAADEYSVIMNRVVADTIDDIEGQLKEDFGTNPEIGQLCASLDALDDDGD
jgi:hypothetical protein